jgi:hypothetical protein
MNGFEMNGGHGFFHSKTGILTFNVQGFAEREDIREKEYRSLYSRYALDSMTMRLGDFTVPFWGEGHNLYPQQVFSTTSENKLLPEVIRKQVKFLFGKGPRLFQEVIQGEGEKQRRARIPVEMPDIHDWLESWEETGYNHYWDYLKNLITDYYYVNTCVTKYEFSRARRLPGSTKTRPVQALTYVGSDEARLATRKDSPAKRITNRDCSYVIVGDWMQPNRYQYEVYNRLDPADPFRHPTAIAFNADKTFTKSTYALNDWFKGLFEWIKASNLSPKYLNSYLKNALNAHVHVIIPGSWYNQQRDILQRVCNENRAGDVPVQTHYRGLKLVDEKGKPVPFYETMVEELIAHELRAITSMMTGEGKNQGKLWASTRWAKDDGWEFQEFPGKFKEYFDSVISLDQRADQVILAGKGIASSITNVENDGVISKSGSDVYYNYLIYVASLTLDEYFILKEINRAIHLNFPEARKQGIRLGFWIDIPAKLQETTPSDRPAQTATADTKSSLPKNEEQNKEENKEQNKKQDD